MEGRKKNFQTINRQDCVYGCTWGLEILSPAQVPETTWEEKHGCDHVL